MPTLYGFVHALPQLAGRVFWDGTAPANTPAPYAIVWAKTGGIERAFYRGADAVTVYPCVTVYDRPRTGEQPAAARVRLQAILDALQDAVHELDTHSDGVTPYLPGSVERTGEPAIMADRQVAGQSYFTFQLKALRWRD